MRAPLSWLREYADLPPGLTAAEPAERMVAAGFEVETIHRPGYDVTGPVVLGRVLADQRGHEVRAEAVALRHRLRRLPTDLRRRNFRAHRARD